MAGINSESETLPLSALLQVLQSLPSLRTLILRSLEFTHLDILKREDSEMMGKFPGPFVLEALTLDSLGSGPASQTSVTTSEIHAVLSIFSSVRTLCLYRIFCERPDESSLIQSRQIAFQPKCLSRELRPSGDTHTGTGNQVLRLSSILSLKDREVMSSHIDFLNIVRHRILCLEVRITGTGHNPTRRCSSSLQYLSFSDSL